MKSRFDTQSEGLPLAKYVKILVFSQLFCPAHGGSAALRVQEGVEGRGEHLGVCWYVWTHFDTFGRILVHLDNFFWMPLDAFWDITGQQGPLWAPGE